MNISDLPRFDVRFENWLRWCREGYREPGDRTGSAEGNWNSPQVWETPDPDMGLISPINIPDAVMLNRAYVRMAGEHRRVLKIVYFRPHWRASWKAQKMGCRIAEIGEKAYRSKKVMQNTLAFLEKRVQNPVLRVTVERSCGGAFSLYGA